MVGFSEQGARRIAKATQYVEKEYKNIPPDPKRIITGINEFYAEITDGGDGTSEKYSFQSLEPKDTHTLEVNEDWLDGTHDSTAGYAIEAKYQSKFIPVGEIVKMRPSVNQDFYLFDVNPDVRVGYLDKDSTMTKKDGSSAGKGELKLSVDTWDSTNETILTEASDSTNTVTVFNRYSTEFEGDGTNDIELHYQFGHGGAFWLVGADCTGATDGT